MKIYLRDRDGVITLRLINPKNYNKYKYKIDYPPLEEIIKKENVPAPPKEKKANQ